MIKNINLKNFLFSPSISLLGVLNKYLKIVFKILYPSKKCLIAFSSCSSSFKFYILFSKNVEDDLDSYEASIT